MMRVHYDLKGDALSVDFVGEGVIVESEEVAPGVILDFDATGLVVGIEVLDVRRRMEAVPADGRQATLPRPSLTDAERAA